MAAVYFFYEKRLDALEEPILRNPPMKNSDRVYLNQIPYL